MHNFLSTPVLEKKGVQVAPNLAKSVLRHIIQLLLALSIGYLLAHHQKRWSDMFEPLLRNFSSFQKLKSLIYTNLNTFMTEHHLIRPKSKY